MSPRAGAPGSSVFAACAPGVEELLAGELRDLGLDAGAVPGGAEARGEHAAAVVCLQSRLADGVVARLFEGPEDGLDAAFRAARARLGADAPFAVRREGGRATLSLDAAGSPLFKRGWRARVGAAPLRETLAAAMLRFAGWTGDAPLLDPMCGSGTIAIEAALVAARRAPGLGRRFAFERWPGHGAAFTEGRRARLAAEERTPPAAIHAGDRNMGALRLAQKNAEAARVGAFVRFARGDAREAEPPPGRGLVCVNPPYGSRLEGDPADAWRSLASLCERLSGWSLCVLAPDRGLERLLGRRPERSLTVKNGGLSCRLLIYLL